MSLCYLNGEFLELEHARISPMDRGFLFADGVYEAVIAYDGRAFCADRHLARLEKSMQALDIHSSLTKADWHAIINRLLAESAHPLSYVYLQVTRGVDMKRMHTYGDNTTPTYFAFVNSLTDASKRKAVGGVKAVTVQDTRRQNCFIKSIALHENVMAAQVAKNHAVDESIFIRDNYALEAASGNLFVVKNEVIKTTPLINNILPGITREIVLECARPYWQCEEQMITRDKLVNADEVWVTSTTREVIPVIAIDDSPVAGGKPGVVHRKIYELFQQYKEIELARSERIESKETI